MKIAFIIMLVSLAGWSLWRLACEADRIHGGLDAIRRRAFNATTEEELEDAEVALRIFAAENCWNKHFTTHAREVLSYIQGRKR